MKNRLLTFFFLFFNSFLSPAQTPLAINYTTDDGLLSNEVYDIFEDKEGFIWLGSDAGVNRFDGTQLLSYTLKNGLADNDVLSIHQDSKNRIWFLPYNGKLSYWQDGKLFNWNNAPFLKDISSKSHFVSFLEDSATTLWFGSYFDGAYSLDSSNRAKHWSDSLHKNHRAWPQKRFYGVLHMFLDKDGVAHITTTRGNYKIENDSVKLISKHSKPQKSGRFSNVNSTLLFSSTENQISLSNIETAEVIWQKKLPKAKIINALEFLSDSLLYVATDNGVFSFDQEGRGIDHILPGKKTSDILIDREGSLWISTLHNGVFLLRNRGVLNFATKTKYSVVKTGDSILFGGVDLELHAVKENRLNPLYTKFDPVKKPIIEDRIAELKLDSNGQVWIGTYRGLFLLKDKRAEVKYSIGAKHLLFLEDSLLMIDANNILLKFNREELLNNVLLSNTEDVDSNRNIDFKTAEKHLLHYGPLNSLLETQAGQLLISTRNGVLSMEDLKQPLEYLPKGEILSIQQELNGNLWVLDKNKGLYHYIQKENQLDSIALFPTNENVSYSCLWLEKDSIIWVGSNRGLAYLKWEKENYLPVYFTASDGLASEHINDLVLSNDIIYLATSAGISILPRSILLDSIPPLLYIDSIASVDRSEVYYSSSHLSFQNNAVNVHLGGVSFKDEIRFEYELKGKLNQTGSTAERTLFFGELVASDYQLSIVAVDEQGNRSAAKAITFTVKSSLFQKTGRWILALVVLSIVIAVTLYKRNFRLKKKLEENIRKSKEPDKFIMVKSALSGENIKLFFKELYLVKASGDYMELFKKEEKILVRITLKELEKKLKGEKSFLKVHRSYLVNVKKVEAYKSDELKILDQRVPITKKNRAAIQDYIHSSNN